MGSIWQDPPILWITRADMDQVVEIDRQSFDEPWSADEFTCHLKQRNTIGVVLKDDGQVLGFMIYELHKHRLQILRLAVVPDHRRYGFGSQLIARLKHKLSQSQRYRIEVNVPEELLEAQLFFSSCGFIASVIPRADEYQMEYQLQIDDLMQ